MGAGASPGGYGWTLCPAPLLPFPAVVPLPVSWIGNRHGHVPSVRGMAGQRVTAILREREENLVRQGNEPGSGGPSIAETVIEGRR
jgi:hypothetical protein